MRFKNTPDPMTTLEKNEVFVFGANTKGSHGAGSAGAAFKFYGAIMGEIHRTGRCYGIVTVEYGSLGMLNKISKEELDNEFRLFFKAVECEPEKTFYLTKVGLGIAGWTVEEVLNSFNKYYFPGRHKNIVVPVEFE